MIRTLYWENNRLFLLDQTKLPHTIEYVECRTYVDVIDGIKTMKVRGAPAIGVSAAYGMALGELAGEDMDVIGDEIKSARPTAVNLFWAVDKVLDLVSRGKSAVDVAIEMEKDDVAINKKTVSYTHLDFWKKNYKKFINKVIRWTTSQEVAIDVYKRQVLLLVFFELQG